MTGPAPVPPSPRVSAGRLVGTLGGAGALAGFLIVFVFKWTAPIIAANKAEALRQAIQEVLQAPDHYDTLYVTADGLSPMLPSGRDPDDLEQVYLGYRADGSAIGFAVPAADPGFQDVIGLIFGYDPATGTVLGMKVLESKETPGLGDKIEKDSSFVRQFAGVATPLVGVKPRQASGGPGEVDLITGATISSRTVVRAINEVLQRLGPLLDTYRREAAR